MKLGKYKLDYPQAIVLSVGIAAFAVVYLLVPEDTRTTIHEGLAAIWIVAATLLPQLVKKEEDE